VRIGIASSLSSAADILRRALTLAPGHEIVWTATTGAEAVERSAQDAPDLVLLDLAISGLGCAEATRAITANPACAVMIVTDSVHANAGRVFEAMGCGALDVVAMPTMESGDRADGAASLVAKVATIGRLLEKDLPKSAPRARPASETRAPALVAIGASAGGPAAIAALLRGLPKDLPAALVIVQHVDAQFTGGMAAWLSEQSALPVRVAASGDRAIAGTVLLAGTGEHLVMTGPDRFGYTKEPQQAVNRPSIDVFFHSVVKHWRGEVIGVLLTGMGRDGAAGLKALRTKGHYTIAQDQASSAVYGMPKAAAALSAAVDILPIDAIASRVVHALKPRADV
jgi:chemotaxis response regulator CheB